MNKSVFAMTAGALVLSLIGLVYFVALAPKCGGSDHCIKVTVSTIGGPLKIAVNSPELHVHGQDQVIFWDLENSTGQSYKFPDNGIAFNAGDGGTAQFTCERQSKAKFKCKDSGTVGHYKYIVTLDVGGVGDPPVSPLDPWIYNE
jgi:hypothetical protein